MNLLPDMTVENLLAHHGIKGMHWGVRNDRDSASSPAKTGSSHSTLKKAAIIGGTVAGLALIAGGTYYLAKNGDLPVSSFGSAEKAAGEKLVEDKLKPSEHELKGIVHVAGVKNHSDATFRTGGVSDPFDELVKAGLVEPSSGDDTFKNGFNRYGSNLEKVGVRFPDPHGRTDHSGRLIHHAIVLPKEHTSDITNFEEAKAKAWALQKDDYEKFWQYGLKNDYSAAEAKRLGIKD